MRQTDERSHVKGSLITKCYGDEPGTGGGVISGTHNAECEPKTWSETVRAEGRNMVRHDDEWWMNHKNTWGKLTYIKDPKNYDTKAAKAVKPLMDDKRVLSDANPDPIKPGQQYAQAVTVPVPGIGPMPPPLPPDVAKPAADSLWKGATGLGFDEGETWSEYAKRPLYNLGIKKRKAKEKIKDDIVRITRPEVKKTCSEQRHTELKDIMKALQALVFTNRYFKTENPRWLPLVMCDDATKRLDSLEKLRDARQKIQDECSKDKPEDCHKDEIDQLDKAIKKAKSLKDDLCGPQS